MSSAKTEQPTPKKLRDARKKGQVFRSNDLTQAFLFLAAAGVLWIAGTGITAELRSLFHDALQPALLTGRVGPEGMLSQTGDAFRRFLFLLLPLAGTVFLVSAGVGLLQVRPLFTPEAVKPQLGKLNPVSGFRNIFLKARTYIELLKNIVKFAVILALCYVTIRGSLRDLVLAARVSVEQAAVLASGMMFAILWKTGGAFLLIGGADYLLQKKMYMKEMMMSKDEVIREFKEEEGDPHIKQRRHQLHQELIAESAVLHVPKADVVVVNPTHLAVAVRYSAGDMNAPQITAKGQNLWAEKIIEIARQSRVPVARNVPLAHSLFELEVGSDIPEDLYEAVAEVLNWVYQLKRSEAS